MYTALITIQGHIADHRYLAAVFRKEKMDWPAPSGKGDNTYWYRKVTSDKPDLLKKWGRRYLAIAMSALKARNRGTRGNLTISDDTGTVWYEEQVTPEGPRVLVDKIENPIDPSVYKHGVRIYAPGAPTYVPRGTVIGKKGDIVIVQLDRKKGFHGGTITRSGTLDIALSPTESWSYELFTKNPHETDEDRWERLVDDWQAKEDLHYTKALDLMREFGLISRHDAKTRQLLAEQIMTELEAMANAARYSGQAHGLLSGEEPPEAN